MSKKDYERAAVMTQNIPDGTCDDVRRYVMLCFIELFADDNPRFDEARFRLACVPGNNVRARPRKGS